MEGQAKDSFANEGLIFDNKRPHEVTCLHAHVLCNE